MYNLCNKSDINEYNTSYLNQHINVIRKRWFNNTFIMKNAMIFFFTYPIVEERKHGLEKKEKYGDRPCEGVKATCGCKCEMIKWS